MLNSLIPLRVAMQRLSANLGGVDLSKFDLDAPLPDIPVNDMRVSAVQSYIAIARREGTDLASDGDALGRSQASLDSDWLREAGRGRA